jgi:phage tail-like protein
MAANGRTMDPPSAAAFVFTVDDVIMGSFHEVSGLGVQLEVEEIVEGGNNESAVKLPGRLKWTNLVLKRGITDNNHLLEWMETFSGDGFAGKSNQVQRRTGSISLFDSMHQEVRSWHFREAMPVRWTGPQFAAGSNAVAMEELEVSHGGFTS